MRFPLDHVRLALLLGVAVASPAMSQPTCASLPAARQAVERGWTAYRGNDMTAAGNEFKRALSLFGAMQRAFRTIPESPPVRQ